MNLSNKPYFTVDHIYVIRQLLGESTRYNIPLYVAFIDYFIRGEKLSSRNVGGVGFVEHPSVVHLVDSHKVLSPRFAILRLRHMHLKTISIVNCYSTNSTADEVKLDAFNDQLKGNICNEKSLYKLVLGDLNARLGEAQEEQFRIGKLGMRDGNENGNRLTELLSAARLFHGNSFFQKK
ncbi:hypothetical protein V3C99_018599 [Haemonchus contortus]|uniref:Craniofacial development protein 2-like n=1 Tax=Haemonchus contortus TaxID=6289 RepID=A0A7I4Z290_HAECO|nr:endonuclease-reverse transcriptase [Haemonchus contortus]